MGNKMTTLNWPTMPDFGDDSYDRYDWLLETDPLQLRDEARHWKWLTERLASCVVQPPYKNMEGLIEILDQIKEAIEVGSV